MKLFIDDIREAPEGWVLARSISSAVNLIQRYQSEITHISFDHDISFSVIRKDGSVVPHPSPDTFKVVCYYVVEKIFSQSSGIREDIVLTTHSANPVGRKEIVAIFNDVGCKCTETPYEPASRRAL